MNSGVSTTITLVGLAMLAALAGSFAVAALLCRAEENKRGWRFRFVPLGIRYEERKLNEWLGIFFEEKGDCRESPHYFDIESAEFWKTQPTWAQSNRDKIISRLKEELKSPHYFFIDSRRESESQVAIPAVIELRTSPPNPII